MGDNYYSYKGEKYSCEHCGWTGLGNEVKQGERFNDGFEVNCPNCHERFTGLILFTIWRKVPQDHLCLSV